MSARILKFTSSILRSNRPRGLYHARTPRRTLFGLGSKLQPSATATPELDEAEIAKATEWAQSMFKDKPDAVNAVINFAKVMEESGLRITSHCRIGR
jgi:hypothetical protein